MFLIIDSTAFFVFFPAATGTRIVAAHFGFIPLHRLRRRRLGDFGKSGRSAAARRFFNRLHAAHPLRFRVQELRPGAQIKHTRDLFLAHHLNAENQLDPFFLDALDHRVKKNERLTLIFHERIALAVGAQPDAFL